MIPQNLKIGGLKFKYFDSEFDELFMYSTFQVLNFKTGLVAYKIWLFEFHMDIKLLRKPKTGPEMVKKERKISSFCKTFYMM